MHTFSTNFFKYMVYGDPSWDYKSFDVAREIPAAQKIAAHLNTTDPDLKAVSRARRETDPLPRLMALSAIIGS